MDATIKFPVLNFSYGEKHVFAVSDAASLGTCNALALRKGYFKDLRIVDSDGKCFQVRGVKSAVIKAGYMKNAVVIDGKRPKPKGPLWRLSVLLNRTLKVELDLSKPTQFTLDDFKDRVCKVIDRDADFWSAGTGSHEDVKADIRKAKTFKEAIQRLS